VSSAYHIIGVGSGHDFSQQFLPQGNGLQYISHSTWIPYFLKNGTPCGAEAFVGIAEDRADMGLTISPVPSTGQFTLEANSPIQRIDVFDMMGRNIQRLAASGPNVYLELGDRPDGIYMAHVLFLNGTRADRMIVVAH
jgi:hypothetical protein